MNILVVADVDPTEIIGGAERALAGQLNELVRRGHKIRVLTRRQDGFEVDEVCRHGYRVVRYTMPEGRGALDLLGSLRAIASSTSRLIAEERPDIVYIQQPLSGAGAMLCRSARQIPALYQFHSPWSDEYRLRLPRASGNASDPESLRLTASENFKLNLRRWIEDYVIRRSSTVLVLSQFMRERCQRLHSAPDSKFSVVPGGVDTLQFNDLADRDLIRRKVNVCSDEQLLLTVRNLEPRMGLSNLIAAMPAILKQLPRTVCIIGGTGAMAGELKAQADGLQLGDRVRFAGFIPEEVLPEYYAAADLFVLPTTALEGFGMVTVEALSCGTPVVGTPVGATPEILCKLDNELVLRGVEPQDIASGCLAYLQRSTECKHEIRKKCRAFALDNYSWKAVVDGIEAALMRASNAVI